MICYHHNDLDGRCAAAIVLKKYPNCRMREIDYNENPDFKEEVRKEEEVLIVDFSFKPKKMKELLRITSPHKIIWIDHHKTAKNYVYGFEPNFVADIKGLQDFSEPGLSGCELTWQYLFPEEPMPEAVRLLGDYDTWRFDTKEKSLEFQFGMRSLNNKPESTNWPGLLEGVYKTVESVQQRGEAIINYKNTHNNSLLKHRYEVFWEGHNCLVVNTPMVDSTLFEKYRGQFDICLCWWKVSTGFIVSLRSEGHGVDVSAIAKRYGGGGHKGAAGFPCAELPEIFLNPTTDLN